MCAKIPKQSRGRAICIVDEHRDTLGRESALSLSADINVSPRSEPLIELSGLRRSRPE